MALNKQDCAAVIQALLDGDRSPGVVNTALLFVAQVAAMETPPRKLLIKITIESNMSVETAAQSFRAMFANGPLAPAIEVEEVNEQPASAAAVQ